MTAVLDRAEVYNDYSTFAQIPTNVLRSTLSSPAKLLYAFLWDYADRRSRVGHPTRKRLAADLGASLATVDRAVAELKEFGALEVIPRFTPEGDRTANGYRLLVMRGRISDEEGGRICGDEGVASPQIQEPEPVKPEPVKPETPRKRGTRLPEPFMLTGEMRMWARGETPQIDVDAETRAFVDHFRAVPGQKGVMLDWQSCWRNWMRRQQKWWLEKHPAPPQSQRPRTAAEIAAHHERMMNA